MTDLTLFPGDIKASDMTLRHYLIAQALAALLKGGGQSESGVAESAVRYADAVVLLLAKELAIAPTTVA